MISLKKFLTRLSLCTNPAGTIIAYYGSTAPSGYLVCDGSKFDTNKYSKLYQILGKNTLPNLVDKFIYGGTSADIGAEGGEATHTLTIDEMPSHAHGYSDYQPRTGSGRGGGSYTVGIVEAWRDTVTVGGSQPHNNIPPYVKLLYCISTGGVF